MCGLRASGIYLNYPWGGGGYFQGAEGISSNDSINRKIASLGGAYNQGSRIENNHYSGNGGAAGIGGIIKASNESNIYAFNGNLYTDDTNYNNGINQCPIYAQIGIYPAKYIFKTPTSSSFSMTLSEAQKSLPTINYINKIYTIDSNYSLNKVMNINSKIGIETNELLIDVDMSKQGVGSGAGYIEVSNGKYYSDLPANTLEPVEDKNNDGKIDLSDYE